VSTPPTVEAVLVDFGGVLTTSVIDAFRRSSEDLCGDPELILTVLREDEEGSRLLVEHECGRIDAAAFERGFAERLRAHGAAVEAAGLVDRLQVGLQRDEGMFDAMARLRAAGVPVAVVSNSFGEDSYRGFDLGRIADVVVISGEEGVRKPSRRLYTIACERLGREPSRCVMIDDLEHNLAGAARLGIHGIHHHDATTTVRALEQMLAVSITQPGELHDHPSAAGSGLI